MIELAPIWTVLPRPINQVPSPLKNQIEQRQSVREQMGRTRVEQRTEYDSGQPRNGPRGDAEARECQTLLAPENQISHFHEKKNVNHQRAGLHRFPERLEMRSGHGPIPQTTNRSAGSGETEILCRLYSPSTGW